MGCRCMFNTEIYASCEGLNSEKWAGELKKKKKGDGTPYTPPRMQSRWNQDPDPQPYATLLNAAMPNF